MRKPPLNYLIAVAMGGLVWLLAAMVLGNYLSINVPLLNVTVEDFLGLYRLILAAAVGLGVALACFWFYYGSRPKTAGRLESARRLWDVLLITSLGLGIALTFLLVIVFRLETFSLGQYAIFLAVFSLSTWLLFWITTLSLSPRTVMNCVRGRR